MNSAVSVIAELQSVSRNSLFLICWHVVMDNQEQKPEKESKWETGCRNVIGGLWGLCFLLYVLGKIDTPVERRILVLSIIAFVVVFLLLAWQGRMQLGDWGESGCALIFAILAFITVWVIFWIYPILHRMVESIQEWIELG